MCVLPISPSSSVKMRPRIGWTCEQAQQRRRPHHGDDALRIALAAERDAAGVVERLFLEDVRLAQTVVVVGHARRPCPVRDARARIGVVHVDELLGVRHGQRLQQHRVDDRENRGVGADADGERQDGGGGEAAVLPQQPGREFTLLKQTIHVSPRQPFLLDTGFGVRGFGAANPLPFLDTLVNERLNWTPSCRVQVRSESSAHLERSRRAGMLPCGCVIGIYETYDGRSSGLLDERQSTLRRSHARERPALETAGTRRAPVRHGRQPPHPPRLSRSSAPSAPPVHPPTAELAPSTSRTAELHLAS